jgi:hypothetical protein
MLLKRDNRLFQVKLTVVVRSGSVPERRIEGSRVVPSLGIQVRGDRIPFIGGHPFLRGHIRHHGLHVFPEASALLGTPGPRVIVAQVVFAVSPFLEQRLPPLELPEKLFLSLTSFLYC